MILKWLGKKKVIVLKWVPYINYDTQMIEKKNIMILEWVKYESCGTCDFLFPKLIGTSNKSLTQPVLEISSRGKLNTSLLIY